MEKILFIALALLSFSVSGFAAMPWDLEPISPPAPYTHLVWQKLIDDWNSHHAEREQLENNEFAHTVVWPNRWLKLNQPSQYQRSCKIISTTPGVKVTDAIDTELANDLQK
jgi:hypothetical protein